MGVVLVVVVVRLGHGRALGLDQNGLLAARGRLDLDLELEVAVALRARLVEYVERVAIRHQLHVRLSHEQTKVAQILLDAAQLDETQKMNNFHYHFDSQNSQMTEEMLTASLCPWRAVRSRPPRSRPRSPRCRPESSSCCSLPRRPPLVVVAVAVRRPAASST